MIKAEVVINPSFNCNAMFMDALRATIFCVLVLVASNGVSEADGMELSHSSLALMSVEELMDVKISTASKKSESAFDTASSVYVITNEDIRRSGATSLPEALRFVPGLNVSRVDLNHYIISGAINTDFFTDKLLVLIDGRALQSPTFSQVWWPAQMYPLEDIERIEVIRGAGSALWGANAMSGVINVITKKSSSTVGGLVSGGGGKVERGFVTIREGARVDDTLTWRAYAMGDEAGGARFVSGERSPEPKDKREQNNYKKGYQAGFRTDWDYGSSRMTLHGDVNTVSAFTEGAHFVLPGVSTVHFVNDDQYSGHNLVWLHEKDYGADYSTKLQLYYDRSKTDRIFFVDDVQTMDAEAQVDIKTLPFQTLSIGLNYRSIDDKFQSTQAMDKPSDTGSLYGLFVEDEIRLLDNRLKTVIGFKAERNNYTGFEIQPNLKLAWIEDRWMSWASASRSVRLPNTVNNNLKWVVDSIYTDPSQPETPLIGEVVGKGTPSPEEVISYELGARFTPDQSVGFDAALFYNKYSNILSLLEETTQHFVPGSGIIPDHNVYDLYYTNMYEGASYGGTVSATWKPAVWMKLFAGYTYAWLSIKTKDGIPENRKHDFSEYMMGSTPLYSVKGGAQVDLPHGFQFDLMAYYEDAKPNLNVFPHLRIDVRLAARLAEKLELAFVSRQVNTERFMEWYSPWTLDNTWVNRDYYLKLTYEF